MSSGLNCLDLWLNICWLLFRIVEWLIGFATWNNWKSKSLSYFLDKRAVQMVSGASMIFSAPKVQWVEVFKRLNISSYSIGDEMTEAIVSDT